MSKDTKQHILKTGQELILRKGYSGTGLNEVLEEAGVPKGSFYYYFSSKEDFGLQVIDFYDQAANELVISCLQDTSYTPFERLRLYFQRNIDYLASMNYEQGCLLGTLGQELSNQNETIRNKVDEALEERVIEVAACLREAQAAGQLSPDVDVETLAAFCLNSWQGAILRMKVVKNAEPLETFVNVLFSTILRS